MTYTKITEQRATSIVGCLLLLGLLAGCQSGSGPDRYSETIRFDYGEKEIYNDLRPDPLPFEYEKSEYQADPPEQVSFEMIRIPGDDSKGIEPFYLAKTEVTSAMFMPWASGFGLNKKEHRKWNRYDIRPSWMSPITSYLAFSERPALGFSRRLAELYCEWLSDHTGRNYRLPTEQEWRHALALGGDPSGDPIELKRQAVVKENAEAQFDLPFFELPAPVGSRWPNALGLYDMLGNAAEWVADTGEERVVVGGHYKLRAQDLTSGWRESEGLRYWVARAPFGPGDWYAGSHEIQGIRLACDADQAPKSPPDVPQTPESPAP